MDKFAGAYDLKGTPQEIAEEILGCKLEEVTDNKRHLALMKMAKTLEGIVLILGKVERDKKRSERKNKKAQKQKSQPETKDETIARLTKENANKRESMRRFEAEVNAWRNKYFELYYKTYPCEEKQQKP